jgi:hypothetical protein
MTEGTDLNQTRSITFYCRRSRACQPRERVRRKTMKGDYTDEFLDDEVEDDDNDNKE